nr:hypothetical protein [Tanacetum cinerariifolium]
MECGSIPAMVLDDECLFSKDVTNSLMGRSKDLFRSNVGAGSWFSVLQQAEYDFTVEGRIVWVEVKGVLNSCQRSPGWILEIMEVSDDDEQSVEDDKGGDIVVHEVGNHGEDSDVDEVPETMFDESSGQKKKQSEDPFGIYPLLDKQRKINSDGDTVNGESLKYPSGFTPINATEMMGQSNKNVEKQNRDRDKYNNVEEPLNGQDDCSDNMGTKPDDLDSGCSGRFKKSVAPRTGGSIFCLMEEVVKVGQTIGDVVGNSGGILCVWETNEFCKTNCTISDYFVIVRGVWVKTGANLLIDGEVVMMVDFNEVRFKFDRFGSFFNKRGADMFNSFISNASLKEVPLGGCAYTWCHKSASKMSKLDRFLISENLMHKCPNLSPSINLSHMFYADVAVFIGHWNDSNIKTLVNVLECFYRASGLRINMCKSKIIGVHVEGDLVKHATSKLGCLILNTLFVYLGMKVGGKISWVKEWNEVVDKVVSRLSKWKMKTLSIGGRLTLLKSVLRSILIFHMSIYRVPSRVLQQMESIRNHFFNGNDNKKATWIKCSNVLADKAKGRLGVSSLYALNRGLMIKWLWRFYARNTSLWVSVLQAKGVNVMNYVRLKLGNRESTSFWEDYWINGGVLKDVFPRLYALEMCKRGAKQAQLDILSDMVREVGLVPMSDRYIWSLEGSKDFSVASIRKVIDDKFLPNVSSKTRWVKYVPIKMNILAWKVKMDALPVRLSLSTRQITRKVSSWWNVDYVDANSYEEWLDWLGSLRLPAKLKLMLEGVFYVV